MDGVKEKDKECIGEGWKGYRRRMEGIWEKDGGVIEEGWRGSKEEG